MGDDQPKELLIGRIAVERGIITEEQLESALATQERGLRWPLGEILIERGLLTPAQLATLLAVQRERLQESFPDARRRKIDSLFGKMAVRLGFATPAQINSAIRVQARQQQQGSPLSLGQALVGMGVLNKAQIREIIDLQRTQLCACPDCGEFHEVEQAPEGEAPSCPKCRSRLLTPEMLAVRPEARIPPPEEKERDPLSESGLFGLIALQKGFIARQDLDAALAEQTHARERVRLGEVLVRRGALDESRREEILDIQKETLARTKHGRFGEIAMQKGWITQMQLDEALRAQEEGAQIGYDQPIGAVLVQQKALTLEQVEQIVAELPPVDERAQRIRRLRTAFRHRLRRQRGRNTAETVAWIAGGAAAILLMLFIANRIPRTMPPSETGAATVTPTGSRAAPPETPVARMPISPDAPRGSEPEPFPPPPDLPETPPEATSPDAPPTPVAPSPEVPPAPAPPTPVPATPEAPHPNLAPETVEPATPRRTGVTRAATRTVYPKIADPLFLFPKAPADFQAQHEVYRLSQRYRREIRPMAPGPQHEKAFEELQESLDGCVARYTPERSRYARAWGYAAMYQVAANCNAERRHAEAAQVLEALLEQYPREFRPLYDSPLGNGMLLPSWLGVHRSLASIYEFKVDEPEKALRVYDMIIKRFPKTEEADVAWDFVGNYWERRGDYDKAIQCYQQIRTANREHVSAWIQVCQAKKRKAKKLQSAVDRINRRQYAGALEILQNEFADEPLNDEPVFWTGVAYLGLGRKDEAETHFRRYLKRQPKGLLAPQAEKFLQKLGE